MKNNKSSSPCTQIIRQRQNYFFAMTGATTELRDTQIFQQIFNVKFVQERNIFPVFSSKESELLHVLKAFCN